MPIAFARLEFVKRSSGKNACCKAAYNSRSRIVFESNEALESRIYDWSHEIPPVFHEVLLPKGVDEKFKSPEVLWNAAEQKEVRYNSQTGLEIVLALPDDKEISIEDREHLTKSFIQEHFVDKGVAAQIDIHAPSKRLEYSEEIGEKEAKDHNWHAHVLLTTRRFKENGKELEDHKARDVMPTILKGWVLPGQEWGKLWAQHQNQFFEERGLALRVDPEGIVPQEHLGPVRMRGRAVSILNEYEQKLQLNELSSEDPKKILEKITETKSAFTAEDVDRFLDKHIDQQDVVKVREAFWKQDDVVPLLDLKTEKPTGKYSSQNVIEEERRALRIADQLYGGAAFKVNHKRLNQFSLRLNEEQKDAFDKVVSGQKLSCIEGHAGTGKSYLLVALKDLYKANHCVVRGFGPDNATAQVLKEKGFDESENVYRFLFAANHRKRDLNKHREVWILDEAGKLGSAPLLEFLKLAKKEGAQVVLSGNSSQLPSVQRGGLFKVFSERYKAPILENIQRQKEEYQREISKNLAHGKMGQALDAVVRHGDIKWTQTKEEALEGLIKTWAFHRTTASQESSLIIAYTNRELRALNELVHQFRKDAGELGDKEFECDTTLGKIYVNCGDLIEFKRNDKTLGVTRGAKGILVKASEERFTVQLREGERAKEVSFDPKKFRSFQLGYATTYHRSQGKTVDRAFVLHSPMMNREAFYVGLTRHVKRAEFFVSKDDVEYLSALKNQAFRKSFKPSTLEYVTPADVDKRSQQAKRAEEVELLKSSDSVFEKLKGYGLSTFDTLRSTSHSILERYKDRRPDSSFYHPKLDQEKSGSGSVKEVKEAENKTLDRVFDTGKLRASFQDVLKESGKEKVSQLKTGSSTHRQHWKKLSSEHRSLLKEYYQSVDRSASLYTIVRAESEQSKNEKSLYFDDWQKTCGKRNALAYKVANSFSEKELKRLFGSKGIDILQERAEKHEAFIKREDKDPTDLDCKLKENLDTFLYRLFPEGPTRKDQKGLRFGAKGSLAVTCHGAKAGCFFDFEEQKGGGPLQLIQKSLACSTAEAMQWAKDFLGEAPNLPSTPLRFNFKHQPNEEQEWISLKPASKDHAPSLKELSKGLDFHYKEAARYTYRDLDGSILFHTLRLESKGEDGKKIVLPLSFGYYKGSEGEPQWSLKGYQSEKKPLYGLDLLKQYPQSKILIVEGEKTTDAASKLFPKEELICISWSGGAGAVSKSDWQPLFGREVVIWPDNDRAGYDAADTISSELRKVGVLSLHVANKEVLAKSLPPKWDLADPLPKEVGRNFVEDVLLRAKEKAVGLEKLINCMNEEGIKGANNHLANEILWRVEERLRPQLEEKHGSKLGEINAEILTETIRILRNQDVTEQELMYEAMKGVRPRSFDLLSSVSNLLERNGKESMNREFEKVVCPDRQVELNREIEHMLE